MPTIQSTTSLMSMLINVPQCRVEALGGVRATRPEREKYVSALEATEASGVWRSAGPELGLQGWTGNLHGHQSPPGAIGLRAKDGSRS